MSTDETIKEPIFEGTNPEPVSDEGSSSPAVDEGGEGTHTPLIAAPPSAKESEEKASAPKKKSSKKKAPPSAEAQASNPTEPAGEESPVPAKSTKSKKKKATPPVSPESTDMSETAIPSEAVMATEQATEEQVAPPKKAPAKKSKKTTPPKVVSETPAEEESYLEQTSTSTEPFDKESIEKEEKSLTLEGTRFIEEGLAPAKDESGQLSEIREAIQSEMETLSDEYGLEDIREAIKDIDFFSGNTSDECLERFCENIKTTLGYCRYHYIKNWKVIKKKRMILKEGKLQALIEELVKKYPSKYIEAILSDLTGEKEFYQVLKELNIDTNFQEDDAVDIDLDDDISVETRSYTATRVGYDDDEIL